MTNEGFNLDSLKIANPAPMNKRLELGTYPITKATVISAPALVEIKEMLLERLLSEDQFGTQKISEKELNQIMDEIGTEWNTKQGNWPKRFTKVFKHRRNQKFSNDFLSKVGKIARESCADSTGKSLIITKDFDWSPGDYGDDGSCFWSVRSAARVVLTRVGGFALLIHGEEDRPLGRAWCVPYHDSYVVFNAYACCGESISIVAFARILSDTFNFPYYRNVRLTCREMDNGPLWINGGKGYIVGDQEVASIEKVDIDHKVVCKGCGEECRGEAEADDVGDIYCNRCFEGSCRCNECGARVHEDDIIYVDDTALCESCFNDRAFSCYRCGEADWNSRATEYGGERYCTYCAERFFVECEKCGELLDKDEVTLVHGEFTNDEQYCPGCVDKHTFECNTCGCVCDVCLKSNNPEVCEDCDSEKSEDEEVTASSGQGA